MDNAQPDIPLMGNFKGNQEAGKKTFRQELLDKSEPDTAKSENKEEIQLSDILKPSTLIFGIITLVLTVIFGWYILVLKPALNDNESMIHFGTPDAATINPQKNIGLAKSERSQSLPTKSITEVERSTSDTTKPSNATATASSQAVPPQNVESSAQLVTPGHSPNKIANAKTSHWKKNRDHKHRRALNNRNLKSPGSDNQSKCSQAQIAMQQCIPNP